MLGTLRRHLGGPATAPAVDAARDEAPEPLAPATREVEFAGYAEDCRLFGFVRLADERMTDLLNEREELEVDSVLLVSLADGRATEAAGMAIRRDDLLAVRAAGPRGNPERRRRTRPSPVTLQAGPYVIRGYVHGPPGADPITQFRRRPPMVPLTEAWIEYVAAGEQHQARVGTIIVNRDQVDWIRVSKDAEVRLADLPAETTIDPRAKDLTGHIRFGEAATGGTGAGGE
ncbi:MAG: hypothetical protein AB1627_07130 [Chloroflexota bacterium]